MQRYSQAKPALHLAGKVAVVRYFVTRQGQVRGCGTLVAQPSTQQYTQSRYHGCRAAKAPPHATTGQALLTIRNYVSARMMAPTGTKQYPAMRSSYVSETALNNASRQHTTTSRSTGIVVQHDRAIDEGLPVSGARERFTVALRQKVA